MYCLHNGREITRGGLQGLEFMGLSEVEIAEELGITRQWLWGIRKRLKCVRVKRSNCGQLRVSLEEQRKRKNGYMRKYYYANKKKRENIRIKGKTLSEACYSVDEVLGRVL